MAQRADVLPAAPLPPDEAERRLARAGSPARALEPLSYSAEQAHAVETDALMQSATRMAHAGATGRALVQATRTAGAPVEAAIQLAAPGTETPYGRGARGLDELKAAGLDPTSPAEATIGTLAGSIGPFEAASVATGPVTKALVSRLAARGVPGAVREAIGGVGHTAATLSLGSGAQTTVDALANRAPLGEALESGVLSAALALEPTPVNLALMAAGGLGRVGARAGRLKEAGYAERLENIRAERAARERGEPFQPPLPTEGPDRLRSLTDAELVAQSPQDRELLLSPQEYSARVAEARRRPPSSLFPPEAPRTPAPEPRLPAGAPEVLGGTEAERQAQLPKRGDPGVLGSGPILGGGRANLLAGGAGAAAGYAQGDTPEEKAIGALAGATIGSGIVESLRRRRGGRLASGPIVPHEERPAPLAPDVSGFRSRMRTAIETAPFARGTAEQWRAHLAKGVNQAELKDTGLGAFLDERKGQVLDRDAVLAAGQPTPVHEVLYGEPKTRTYGLGDKVLTPSGRVGVITEQREDGTAVVSTPRQGDHAPATVRVHHSRLLPLAEERPTPPRYAKHQLPGGTNYREVVLTTPQNPPPLGPIKVGERVASRPGTLASNSVVGQVVTVNQRPNRLDVALRDEHGRLFWADANDLTRGAELGRPSFTSSHWPGVENPVAHIRLTDRTTPDGKKVTFLEEIQSDVHEQGREKGYRGDPQDFEVVPDPHDPTKSRVREKRTGQLRPTYYSTPEVAQRAIDGGLEGASGVPRLPFSRTEDWVGLAVRRALAEAVHTGSDRLAWTTGVQQAERWSQQLQRGLSGVRWDPEGNVLEFRRQGAERWESYGDDVTPDELSGVVGRQIADQLKAQAATPGIRARLYPDELGPQDVANLATAVERDRRTHNLGNLERRLRDLADRLYEAGDAIEASKLDNYTSTSIQSYWLDRELTDGQAVNWRTVEGTDLVIGAQGMRTFYDEIVPRVVTDYLKKLGVKDVKVEDTPLAGRARPRGGRFTVEDLERVSQEAEAAGDHDVADAAADVASLVGQAGEADFGMQVVREGIPNIRLREAVTARLRAPGPTTGATVHSIAITPELKAKVQSGEGTYLYSGLDPTLLKKLPPEVLGGAIGAGVGASQGKDTKERIALGLAGAAVGAVGGRRISQALRDRRATAVPGAERGAAAVMPVEERPPEVPREPERQLRLVPNEPAAGAPAAQPGGLPVEPPVRPADYVNPAKFDLDPTGHVRLDAEVERLVTQTGLHPKTVVTHAEVRRAADDLGLDLNAPDQQVNRRISGAKLLAIRNVVSANIARSEQLAHELAEPTTLSAERRTEVTRQLTALDVQNSNLLSEFIRARRAAGRELNALKIVAKRSLDPAVWWAKARALAGRDLTAEELSTIRRLVEERDRAGLVQTVSRLRTSTVGEQLTTLWKAGLLTNPKTHVVNITGNTAMAALETAKDPVSAGFDWLLSLRTQQRTKGGLNRFLPGASARGISIGLREAHEVLKGRLAGTQLERGTLPRETVIDLPGLPKSANALLDGYQRWVYRMLGASDQVFVSLALQRSLAEQANLAGKRMGMRGVQLREYVAGIQRGEGPLADVITAQAVKDANIATFHDVTRLGRAAASFAKEVPGGQFIVPFQKTPGAVATRVLEYSPLGLGKGIVDAVRVGLKGKDAPPALQRIAAEELGRGATGSGLVYLGYMLAHYGLMTGAVPTTGSRERQQWLQEGKRPNALLVGKNWLEIGRLSPVGNLLALGANLRRAVEEPKTPDLAGRAAEVGFSALRTVADQPFVTGASQALAAIQEPEREASRFAQGLAASVVPAAVGAVARGTDVGRVPELEAAGPFSGVAGAVAERIPGVRKALPAKRDAFGQRVSSRGILNAMFSPTTASPDLRQSDPVVGALADAGYAVPRLPKRHGEGAIAYEQRQRLYGAVTRAALEATLQSGDYAAAVQVDQQLDAAVAQAQQDPRFQGRSPAAIREALLAVAQQGGLKTRADVLDAAVASVRRQLKAGLQ